MSSTPNNKFSNTITASAYMLGVSPETVNAWLSNSDRISELESEVKMLNKMLKEYRSRVADMREKVDKILSENE